MNCAITPWVLILSLTWISARTSCADTLKIANSASPDGKYYFTIDPEPPGSGDAAGTAQVRDKKTDKIVGTFDWDGFGESPDENAFSVLWQPGDKAFAISYESTRGYVSCDVYVLRHGKCLKLTLPDYVKQAMVREGVKEGSDKGYEEPKEWLPHSVLKIQVYNKAMAYDYWAFLRIPEDGSTLTAKLQKLVRKPPAP